MGGRPCALPRLGSAFSLVFLCLVGSRFITCKNVFCTYIAYAHKSTVPNNQTLSCSSTILPAYNHGREVKPTNVFGFRILKPVSLVRS